MGIVANKFSRQITRSGGWSPNLPGRHHGVFFTKPLWFSCNPTPFLYKTPPRNHGLTRDLHIFGTIEWGVSYWGMGSIFPKEIRKKSTPLRPPTHGKLLKLSFQAMCLANHLLHESPSRFCWLLHHVYPTFPFWVGSKPFQE